MPAFFWPPLVTLWTVCLCVLVRSQESIVSRSELADSLLLAGLDKVYELVAASHLPPIGGDYSCLIPQDPSSPYPLIGLSFPMGSQVMNASFFSWKGVRMRNTTCWFEDGVLDSRPSHIALTFSGRSLPLTAIEAYYAGRRFKQCAIYDPTGVSTGTVSTRIPLTCWVQRNFTPSVPLVTPVPNVSTSQYPNVVYRALAYCLGAITDWSQVVSCPVGCSPYDSQFAAYVGNSLTAGKIDICIPTTSGGPMHQAGYIPADQFGKLYLGTNYSKSVVAVPAEYVQMLSTDVVEVMKISPCGPGMVEMTWNALGALRPGFQKNCSYSSPAGSAHNCAAYPMDFVPCGLMLAGDSYIWNFPLRWVPSVDPPVADPSFPPEYTTMIKEGSECGSSPRDIPCFSGPLPPSVFVNLTGTGSQTSPPGQAATPQDQLVFGVFQLSSVTPPASRFGRLKGEVVAWS